MAITVNDARKVGFYFAVPEILEMIAEGGGSAPNATPSVRGLVLQGAAVANATDEASAVTQLNALMDSLRAAGVIQQNN